jgi:Tol biopolymer transport system component
LPHPLNRRDDLATMELLDLRRGGGWGGCDLVSIPGDDFGAAWSPDGRQIAFVRDWGALGRSVFVMNADGSDQHPVNPGGTQLVPAWQPRKTQDHDADE